MADRLGPGELTRANRAADTRQAGAPVAALGAATGQRHRRPTVIPAGVAARVEAKGLPLDHGATVRGVEQQGGAVVVAAVRMEVLVDVHGSARIAIELLNGRVGSTEMFSMSG